MDTPTCYTTPTTSFSSPSQSSHRAHTLRCPQGMGLSWSSSSVGAGHTDPPTGHMHASAGLQQACIQPTTGTLQHHGPSTPHGQASQWGTSLPPKWGHTPCMPATRRVAGMHAISVCPQSFSARPATCRSIPRQSQATRLTLRAQPAAVHPAGAQAFHRHPMGVHG